ncbi:MAG: exonuclease SbcCD subunit D C-terminal domain-containing protein, partial [Lachnospiraceae bacterium]|nr:exonuclease SbcCD subunit D C-terminal domain-containing protein [Lachnospiraceae bacterium]
SDYTDAMRTVINEMQADPNARNILLSHQFITGAARSESEDIIVGGLDNVDASVFRDFDYTALGHIHNAQNISADNPVRYCGTPLKYSISEASQNKSVTVVDIREKGNVSLEFIPLVPMRDLREIRGNYDDLMSRWNYEGTNTKDYIHVTLTDETDVIDAVSRMRSVYPNIIKLDYDNTRTRTVSHIEPVSVSESMSHLDLFRGFFKLQNGKDITDEQEKLLVDLIEKIREEDNQ